MASLTQQLQDKWEQITPRERAMVGLLGITGVVLVLMWIGYSIRDGLVAIEKRNDETREALRVMDRYRTTAVQKTSTAPKVAIPDEALELSGYLDKIAGEVGIKIPGYKQRPAATKGKFTEVSTRINIRGMSVYELKDFLEKVESNNLVVITNLHITRRYRDKEKLDVDLVVATYKNAPPAKSDKDKKGG